MSPTANVRPGMNPLLTRASSVATVAVLYSPASGHAGCGRLPASFDRSGGSNADAQPQEDGSQQGRPEVETREGAPAQGGASGAAPVARAARQEAPQGLSMAFAALLWATVVEAAPAGGFVLTNARLPGGA